MTEVTFDRQADGIARAYITVKPFRDDDDYSFEPFRVQIIDGLTDPFTVDPNPVGNAVVFQERGFVGARRRTVLVPDVASVDYDDLEDVDPETLAVTNDLPAAWVLAADDIQAQIDGIEVGGVTDAGLAPLITAEPSETRTAVETVVAAQTGPLGTAAAADAADFATAAQGTAADTAVQPADIAAVATSGLADDLTGTLPSAVLPPLAVKETYPVASQAAMLALTAERGDLAVRTDLDPDRTFILTTDSPATLADWVEIQAGGVQTVNGQSGTSVVLTQDDVGLPLVDNTADADKPVSTATQAELDLKATQLDLDAVDSEVALKTNRDLPADVPATVTGQYDQRTNGYNVKSSNVRRIRAALGRAAATGPDAGLARIVVLGDSKSDQFNGSDVGNGGYDVTFTKWPWRLREHLAAALDAPIGGTGFVKAYHAGVYDPRWSFTGTWDNLASGPYSWANAIGEAATLSTLDSGEEGDTVEVYYLDFQTSPFEISVDGATSGPGFLSVTPTGTNAQMRATLDGLPFGKHEVVITDTTGALLFNNGAEVRGPSGVIVDNFALNGGSAVLYETGQPIGDLARFAVPDPDLVIMAVGPNDMREHSGGQSLTPAALIAKQTQVLATYPDSDVLLVVEDSIEDSVDQVAWDAKWAEYHGALYELADTLDCALLDLTDRWGPLDDPIHAAHLIDGVHQDAAADADWAAAIAGLLVNPGGSSGADPTDATTVAAAGAVMGDDFTANGAMFRTGPSTFGAKGEVRGVWVLDDGEAHPAGVQVDDLIFRRPPA